MFGIGFPELLVVLVIVLVVFGAGRLPEIGTGLGKALRGFKKGMSEPDEIDVTPRKEDQKPTGTTSTAGAGAADSSKETQ